MKSLIRRLLIFIVLVVVAAAGVSLVVRKVQMFRPVQLTNGSSVLLLDVTVGTNVFTNLKWWHGYARRWLPAKFKNWIPPTLTSSGFFDSNSITVWLKLSPKLSNASSPWSSIQAQDQSGRRYDSLGSYSSDSDGLYGFLVSTFPRRKSSFNMVFYDSTSKEIGRLRVPNPVKGPFPKWNAESMPATHTNGPVALMLKELLMGRPNEPDQVATVWEVKAPDSLWDRARVHAWSVHDATGNRSWRLIPGESPIKLRAVLHRVQPESFIPDEHLTLTNLAVPAPGELLPLDLTNLVAGVRVFISCLAGAGELTITNGTGRAIRATDSTTSHWSSSNSDGVKKEAWGSTGPFFVVELGRLPPETEVFYQLRDENGRELKSEQSYGSEAHPGMWTRQIRFDRSQARGRISFDLMISRGRVFEFIVNPADVTTSIATPP